MAERELQLELSEPAKDLLVDKGWDPAMGARPLRRAIQRYIEDPLADFVLRSQVPSGSTVMVDAPDGGAGGAGGDGGSGEEAEVKLTVVEPKQPQPTPVGVGASDGGGDGDEPAAEGSDRPETPAEAE
jgi:ATP-dependent Clp protease ATP-binding subunit ClpC